MNTNALDNMLLLRDSGELKGRQLKRLESAIQASPALQARVTEISCLKALWKDHAAITAMPGDNVIRCLRKENRRLPPPRRPSFIRISNRFHPATTLAAAAAIILLTSLLFTGLPPPHPRPADNAADELDRRISQTLSDIDTSLLALIETLSENGALPDAEGDLLALKLMLMEDS